MEKKKIKVLRIINRFNIGGPTYNATFLTRFLSDDFETVLVGGLPEEGEADSLHILEEYGVKPILISEMKREPNFKSDREAYKKIKSIIEDFKPDVVHTHAAKAGALGRRAASSCGVPVIIHTFHGHVFHSYFGKLKTELFKFIERRLAKKSTKIIAISNLQANELVNDHKICPKNKIEVVPLGFDLDKFNQNKGANRKRTREQFLIEENEIAIAIIGRLAPIKDHNFFLDVIQELSSQIDQKYRLRVFIVGDGSEKQNIQTRLNKMELPSNIKIEMTSWIKDIATFNPGMDIICLTSKNEGTPVSLIEAQASGVPIISTNVGGVEDIVLDGKTGFIVTKGDHFQYTQKLMELITNYKLREEMSERGWEHVREKFHYSTLVKNVEQLYFKLLGKNE